MRASFDLSNLQNEDMRVIFDLIRNCPEEYAQTLSNHLDQTKGHLDVTSLFNSEGHTALTFAATEGKIAAVKCLIGYVKARTEEITSEVSASSSSQHTVVSDQKRADALLERQIRRAVKHQFKCTLSQWINLRDRTELRATALHLAAFNGDVNMISFLVENGADLRVTTTAGVNSLHMAAQGNQPISLNMLLYHYECFDVNQADNSGATPLIWAAFCGSEISLTYLLA